jgi:O-antigen biosynthesis protein
VEVEIGEAVEIGAAVRRADGSVEQVALGRIAVSAAADSRATREARIAICMATFDPDPTLLRRQIESIRAQTASDWMCVISDDFSSPDRYADVLAAVGEDERFTVSRAPERIGFYRNFERALSLAPRQAELIALCDQDDVWHPEKLATLRAAIGSAMLAYSDLRLVDAGGRVLRETFWHGRSNNHTNLASMLIANTVTGAASLMRREVVRRALPFPDSPGIEFHDHWLALVALACGELA